MILQERWSYKRRGPYKLAGHTRWLATQGGGPHKMAGHTRWLATQDGWPHKVAGHTRWLATQDGWPHKMAGHTRDGGTGEVVYQVGLLDMETGTSELILSSPSCLR